MPSPPPAIWTWNWIDAVPSGSDRDRLLGGPDRFVAIRDDERHDIVPGRDLGLGHDIVWIIAVALLTKLADRIANTRQFVSILVHASSRQTSQHLQPDLRMACGESRNARLPERRGQPNRHCRTRLAAASRCRVCGPAWTPVKVTSPSPSSSQTSGPSFSVKQAPGNRVVIRVN